MSEKRAWLYDVLFICVLLIAGYLRFAGGHWGEGYHQHPDELFLTGVLDNLRAHECNEPSIPVDACPPDQQHWMSISDYFNTQTSTLNPYNRGQAFFVYGNLPMTVTRIAMEISGNDDIGRSKFFARQFSALADLLTVFILYLLVSNLYGRRVGLIAATFSTFAVMQIQQSHFFTSDLFVNLFMFLALWFAVKIVNHKAESSEQEEAVESETQLSNPVSGFTAYAAIFKSPLLYLSIGFGVALGMAMASKINAAALAIVLPGAFLVRYFMNDYKNRKSISSDYWISLVLLLVAGGLATIISFRIFQPYAFDGIKLNPQWIANIAEQRAQANGTADLPWNLQWARRTHLYSFTNLTVWGLGLPLGILAWAGFLLMGWRILKGEWKHALLWAWTAFYFGWQSIQFNPTMRYQLPIYPLLCMMAAWFLFELPNLRKVSDETTQRKVDLYGILSATLGVVVLSATAIWAFAFQSIYLRAEPRIAASRWIFQNVPGPLNLKLDTVTDGTYTQPLSFPTGLVIQNGTPYLASFVPTANGYLSSVVLGHALDSAGGSSAIVASLYSASAPDVLLARASEQVNYTSTKDPRGPQVSLEFDKPVIVVSGASYILKLETLGTDLTLSGSAIANETDYDWGLPFRIDNYDPFGGMYRGDLTLQVYWDDDKPDNPSDPNDVSKLHRYLNILDQTDYIFIPTNHQYAQITRLPERYPLTTVYYRELLGCPQAMNIIQCYRTAEVGTYQGRLGFDLVGVFEDYPTLGPLVINDQAAEEAFTFYDHPKVFVFKKSENYDAAQVAKTLGAVDLTHVVHLTPKDAANFKDLMLPADRLATQRAGGTWSQLFSYSWLQNKYPVVGLLVWYVFIFLLGLAAYPIVRYALAGFGAYSYPLGRVVGLALLAWISWFGGSVGIPYTRFTIGVVLLIVVVAGVSLWMMRKKQFKDEWDAHRKFFVFVEILFLIFFIIDLLIRLGNSDMWHESKGGERPMDFSYFNAVLKSTSFPPYDPWFAGGYINYYYYGFVLVGTPVKLLGIVPSIAYNFILPTLFAMVATGAFAIGFNLLEGLKTPYDEENPTWGVQATSLIGGVAASVMMILLGNLGTIKLIFNALERLAAPNGSVPADAGFFESWGWAFKGLGMMFTGSMLPIGRGDWLWFPSRIMPPGPGNEITEFPLFTFLYSDLHAHMLVIPLTLFIIAWALAFIKSHAQMRLPEWVAAILVGALFIGALKPTNTWDLYTFFPFAALAVLYAINRHFEWKGRLGLPDWLGRLLFSLAMVAGLYLLGALMYKPFTAWYGQVYGSVDPWTASHTKIADYLGQWGLFLFIITSWLLWEAREWLASTPLSHLKNLHPYRLLIEIVLALFIALLVLFTYEGVSIVWVVLPLLALSGILLLRPEMPGVKRGVLLMIGTGLLITFVVEMITLRGDIGRMNTVFKIYMQAWVLFAMSAAAAFAWLLPAFAQWKLRWRVVYQIGLYSLMAGAFLFTLTAVTDKVSDRMAPAAPRTLDGMTYMNYAQRWEGNMMDLSEDYRAIRWLQDNIQGSPVIVEANCSEYRWCTRMTIYTGLPGVVGWNWHQRQQRGILATQVQNRVDEIGAFYTTLDIDAARSFLKKYDVKYIVVGQLERNIYPAIDSNLYAPGDNPTDGLAKFEKYKDVYWHVVYHDANTTIYEVNP
ncbi:MAG: DUF2298 domain-containing protein [Anaerolineales bacterium]